jgi:hypothetical protein
MAATIRTDKIGPVSGSADFTLPTSDGSAKSALITDGSKVLSFATGTPSASNFLRGDGTWAAVSDTGGWEMVTRTLVGGSPLANIDFTGMVAGYQYMYSWNGIASSNVGAEDFAMQVSTDAGSSYESSGYLSVCRQYYNTLSSNVFGSTSYFPLSENQSNSGIANGNNGFANLYNIGSASLQCFMNGTNTQKADVSNPLRTNSYGGLMSAAGNVTAVRFYFTTGNILASTTAYITQYKQKIT